VENKIHRISKNIISKKSMKNTILNEQSDDSNDLDDLDHETKRNTRTRLENDFILQENSLLKANQSLKLGI
jgi:hypothetical protein